MARNIEKRRERSKRNFDSKLQKPTLVFNKGDRVLVRKFRQTNKIDDRYQAEIHTVIKKKPDVPLYLVQGLESGAIKTIHRDHLILYYQAETTSSTPIKVQNIITWDVMRHKIHEPDDEEGEYPIKKHFNNRVAVVFEHQNNIDAECKMTANQHSTQAELVKTMKTARDNSLSTCMISLTDSKVETIKTVLLTMRKEVANKTWTKIIVATEDPIAYAKVIEYMCTYFPKTIIKRVQELPSDSDDDSDAEYINPPPPPAAQPDADADVRNQDRDPDDAEDQDSIGNQSHTDSDSSGEEQPGPQYNLRREGRRPPPALNEYYTFTISAP